MGTTTAPVRRALVVCVVLVLLNGVLIRVDAEEGPESQRQAKWRLSWNIVDRGFVSWGVEATFFSSDDCLVAREKALLLAKNRLQSPGNDVSGDETIVQTRRADRVVLTVVHFLCSAEKNWTLVIAHQPRRGAVSEETIGAFPSEEICIDALELEVDFKAKALQKLGNHVSVVQATTTDRTLTTTEASGTEAGQPKAATTYSCVTR